MAHSARLVALASALTAGLWVGSPAAALPVGSAPDTRPAPMQLLPQWQSLGVGTQLSGLVLQGNAQFVNLEAAVDLAARLDQHRFYLNGSGLYTQVGPAVALNRLSGSAIYTYDWLPKLDVWAFTTHAQDQALALKYRSSYAAGLCLDRLGIPGFSDLFLSYGPAYERAWFSDGSQQAEWRHVVRLFATLPLTDPVDIGLDSFYRPALLDAANYRLYGEAFLRVKLTPLVWLLVTAADEYNSRPRTGFQANDVGLYTTLRVGKGW